MADNKFIAVSDGTFGYTRIKSVGPGTVPDILSGMFTTKAIAENAIASYLSSKKETKDGTKTSTGRGKQL